MVQHNDVNSGPSLRTKTTESDEKRTNQKKVADIEKEIRKKNKRRDEIRERFKKREKKKKKKRQTIKTDKHGPVFLTFLNTYQEIREWLF